MLSERPMGVGGPPLFATQRCPTGLWVCLLRQRVRWDA